MSDLLFSVFPNENFVDIGLYQYGWEQCEPSHSFGPAARNHYIFHYVISGTGTLMADDSSGNTIKYQVKSGQGFMLFPNQINTYIADQDLPWEYTWIEFDGLRAKEIVSTAGLSPDHPVYHALALATCSAEIPIANKRCAVSVLASCLPSALQIGRASCRERV